MTQRARPCQPGYPRSWMVQTAKMEQFYMKIRYVPRQNYFSWPVDVILLKTMLSPNQVARSAIWICSIRGGLWSTASLHKTDASSARSVITTFNPIVSLWERSKTLSLGVGKSLANQLSRSWSTCVSSVVFQQDFVFNAVTVHVRSVPNGIQSQISAKNPFNNCEG